jgi:hypothetical protein
VRIGFRDDACPGTFACRYFDGMDIDAASDLQEGSSAFQDRLFCGNMHFISVLKAYSDCLP